MSGLDFAVLVAALLGMVTWGVWQGRKDRTVDGYLVSGRRMPWWAVGVSVMATQASAITFLSTPGQAYTDGMRFVQFYLGLPLAMIVLSISAVPLYHRLRVVTAYEFLSNRFDAKTRSLTAGLFLIQRGLAAGLTIYAPSLILSLVLGWDIRITIAVIGIAVVIYTTIGGAQAVSRTQLLQAAVIFVGMTAAFIAVVHRLPADVSLFDALGVAGAAGRLKAIDFSFDPNDRYTLWTGLLGGFFLQLSYFGTDQSQVQRYLGGSSPAQIRLGLLANGLLKVPMQFAILFLGATVFAFYQFIAPPVFFNPVAVASVKASARAGEFTAAEASFGAAIARREAAARALVAANRAGAETGTAREAYRKTGSEATAARSRAVAAIRAADPGASANDTNYVFLSFVVSHLPAGLIGLVLAAVFAASMSASSAELSALSSTTVVDVVRRLPGGGGIGEGGTLRASRLATAAWGVFAISFAEFAGSFGSLIEAVNVLGSLFYGTILGVFLTAFYLRRVGGTAVFTAAIAAEAGVLACYALTSISFLWFNLIGCVAVVLLGLGVQAVFGRRT